MLKDHSQDERKESQKTRRYLAEILLIQRNTLNKNQVNRQMYAISLFHSNAVWGYYKFSLSKYG